MDTMVIYQIDFFLFLWNGQITNSITPMKMFCGTSWPYWSYIICEFVQIRIVTMVLLDYHSVILYFYRGFAGSGQCRSECRNVDHLYCGFLDMPFFSLLCGTDCILLTWWRRLINDCRSYNDYVWIIYLSFICNENYIVCFMRLDRFNIQIR